jgi:ATP-binding cassette subfamily B (MDR/TAP) protein 1
MATDISLEGDIPSLQPVVDIDRKQDSEKNKAKDAKTDTVHLYKLFTFADPLDLLLMFLGTVGAIGNGISIPLMLLVFGNLINAFGDSTDSIVVDEVSKVIFSLVLYTVHRSQQL